MSAVLRVVRVKTFEAADADALDLAANTWLRDAGTKTLVDAQLAVGSVGLVLTIFYTE